MNNPEIYIVLYRISYSQLRNPLCLPKRLTKLIHSVIKHHQNSTPPRRQPTTGHDHEPTWAVCWGLHIKQDLHLVFNLVYFGLLKFGPHSFFKYCRKAKLLRDLSVFCKVQVRPMAHQASYSECTWGSFSQVKSSGA
jgi:mRNA-degrading endonuclease YafQ of YafQ-DinJ toxin-antitoxin module